MVRADYCGEGRPHTVDGTRIDVCAGLGITYLDRGAVMAAWWPSNVRGVPATPPPTTQVCAAAWPGAPTPSFASLDTLYSVIVAVIGPVVFLVVYHAIRRTV
jgi:hypothetical protein